MRRIIGSFCLRRCKMANPTYFVVFYTGEKNSMELTEFVMKLYLFFTLQFPRISRIEFERIYYTKMIIAFVLQNGRGLFSNSIYRHTLSLVHFFFVVNLNSITKSVRFLILVLFFPPFYSVDKIFITGGQLCVTKTAEFHSHESSRTVKINKN